MFRCCVKLAATASSFHPPHRPLSHLSYSHTRLPPTRRQVQVRKILPIAVSQLTCTPTILRERESKSDFFAASCLPSIYAYFPALTNRPHTFLLGPKLPSADKHGPTTADLSPAILA